MIHDVLLSCLNLQSNVLPLEDILTSGAVAEFLHPSEAKILEDILKIIKLLQDVAKFSKSYGRPNYFATPSHFIDADDETLQNGLYLTAFANGIDKVFDDYLDEITKLEELYLKNPTKTLMHIYQKLQSYEPLAQYLRKLIRGIRLQKLHGCAILSHIHKSVHHGDQRIKKAMKIILSSINVVFFKQLSHWILYAKMIDAHGEFFIQCTESPRNNSSLGSEKGSGSGRQNLATFSDAASTTCGDIWRYEICYELLPYFLSSNWAEKVLFIGQTVLIFKFDVNKMKKNAFSWSKSESKIVGNSDTLWNGQEHLYFAKIQALLNDDEHILHHYERVIDDIKQYVSIRLTEIAINQADLMQQLKTIKEYFLLGRGEIFLDFIRLTIAIEKDKDKDAALRDFVKAFETASHNIGVSEILDQITLSIPKQFLYSSNNEYSEIDCIQKVQLDYCINWPLHLLFSPRVMERYNMIFRFLLLIKKTQYRLNMVWFEQTKEAKSQGNFNVKLMLLRNQLMFFVNTLQYYIQVDVLESQFSILQSTIREKADFEQIQKAHSIFQANILSLCFLLNEDTPGNHDSLQSYLLYSNHPVYLIFHDIFNLCEDFYSILHSKDSSDAIEREIDLLCERFRSVVNQLLTMLVSLKALPGTTALSQLLLRLDFNRWFSTESKLPCENSESD